MRRIGIVFAFLVACVASLPAQNLGSTAAYWITTSGAPTQTCSATSYNGVFAVSAALDLYQCSNSTGTYLWNVLGSSGGGGSPGGSSGQFQYNNGGAFGGTSGITFVGTGEESLASTDSITGSSTTSYLVSDVNTLNISSEWQSQQGSTNTIIGVTGAVSTPNTANIHQTSGLAGFVDSASTVTNAVGVYSQAVGKASGAQLWGANPLCATYASGSGNLCKGIEVDVNANNTGDTIQGVDVTGSWGAEPTTSSVGVYVQKPVGGQWTNAFQSDPGAAGTGLNLGPTAASGANLPSQSILLINTGSGGGGEGTTIYSNGSGNLVLDPYSGLTMLTSLQATNLDVTGTLSGSLANLAYTNVGNNFTTGTQTIHAGSATTVAAVIQGTSAAYATPAIVQTISRTTGTSTGGTFVAGSNITSGNSIVLILSQQASSTPTITDTLGNTFNQMEVNTAVGQIALYVASSSAGGADTITVASSPYMNGVAYEVSGLYISPLDTAANAGGGTLVSPEVFAGITTTQSDMIFTVLNVNGTGTVTASASGFTNGSYINGAYNQQQTAYQVGVAGTYAPSWTNNAAGSAWSGFTVALKASPSGSGSADLLDFKNPSGSIVSSVASTGAITAPAFIGGGSAPAIAFGTGSGSIVSGSTNAYGTISSTTTGSVVFTLTWASSFAYPHRGVCTFTDETTHTALADLILTSSATTTTLTAGGTTTTGDTISYSCGGY
jgi:hypothetical protein